MQRVVFLPALVEKFGRGEHITFLPAMCGIIKKTGVEYLLATMYSSMTLKTNTLSGEKYMLCVNNYTQKYIDECRSKVAGQVSAYQNLVAVARHGAATDEPKLNAAIAAFEPHFFNNLVLSLESYFVHRTRAKELKDGNPLNEVRMLSNSMINNANAMCADKTIKYDPAKSVLKYKIGDEIKLKEADFKLLSHAFFAEIESKYL